MNEIGNKVDVPFGKLLTRIWEGIYFLAVSGERIRLSRAVSWLEISEENPGLFVGPDRLGLETITAALLIKLSEYLTHLYFLLNTAHARPRNPHLISSMLLMHLYRKNYIPGATEFHLIPIQFISNYLQVGCLNALYSEPRDGDALSPCREKQTVWDSPRSPDFLQQKAFRANASW